MTTTTHADFTKLVPSTCIICKPGLCGLRLSKTDEGSGCRGRILPLRVSHFVSCLLRSARFHHQRRVRHRYGSNYSRPPGGKRRAQMQDIVEHDSPVEAVKSVCSVDQLDSLNVAFVQPLHYVNRNFCTLTFCPAQS